MSNSMRAQDNSSADFSFAQIRSTPVRRKALMPANPIVAWTPSRLMTALGAWLMEEVPFENAPVRVRQDKR